MVCCKYYTHVVEIQGVLVVGVGGECTFGKKNALGLLWLVCTLWGQFRVSGAKLAPGVGALNVPNFEPWIQR